MSYKNRRCLIVVLVLVGILIPAAQAFADEPLLPTPKHRLACSYWFNDGRTGTFESEFISPWKQRGAPRPNSLWSGRVKNFFFNPNSPSQPIEREQNWDLAYKPAELGEALELTVRAEGKQCKDYRVRVFRNQIMGNCREIQTARDCEGGGLEDLDRQVCTSKYPWPCGSVDDDPPVTR